MKIKLTQGTVKYFIITAVSTYSGGKTTITVYGGTDYDLADSAISANAYSMMRTPVGFPMSPAKWKVETVYTSNTTQNNPTVGTWYHLGSFTLTLPIGVWDFEYGVTALAGTADTQAEVQVTASTANNSETDVHLTSLSFVQAPTTGSSQTRALLVRRKVLEIASKTVYYINLKTSLAGTNVIQLSGAKSPCIVRATCAYL